MDVQIYRTAPWRATAVFAGAERDDDEEHRDPRDDALDSDAAHSRAQIHAVIAR